MSVWAWLRLSVCLWLIRKTVLLVRWLLLAAAAVAAWPLTMVMAAGYAAAWLRGWPPVRLYRAAAWSLLVTGMWLAALEILMPDWLATRTPGRAWAVGWNQLTMAGLARVFVVLAPVAVPAGLTLAGLVWAWRVHAATAGPGPVLARAWAHAMTSGTGSRPAT
jgi:hypothetical protein